MAVRHRRTPSVRVLAAAGGATALVVLVGGCGNSASDDTSPEHRSFALSGRTLTVDSDDSRLELVSADVAEVEVTRWFDGKVVLGGSPKADWSMQDDRLQLRVRCDGMIADCSAKHRIEVPRGVAVSVRSDDGRITASGFESALKLSTADGRITVRDSGGPLDLHSDDGRVGAEGVTSRQIVARSQDGAVDLELARVPDRVEATSDDGRITIGLPDSTYNVRTKTDDGSTDVSVPHDESSSHVVSAHTKDGGITVRRAK